MAVGPSTFLVNAWLNATFNNTSFAVTTVYAQLHDGDPGAAGTANQMTETDRIATSWAAAAGAAVATDAATDWAPAEATGTETATHVSYWDAPTGGNYLGSGTVTGAGWTDGTNVGFPAGDLDVDMSSIVAS